MKIQPFKPYYPIGSSDNSLFAGRSRKEKTQLAPYSFSESEDEDTVQLSTGAKDAALPTGVSNPESPEPPVDPAHSGPLEHEGLKTASSMESETVERVEEQAPLLAKWFKPVHYRPGGKIEFAPLPQAMIKGLEASVRAAANGKKKPGGPQSGPGNGLSHFESFIPQSLQGKLNKGQATAILNNAQRKLKNLPKSQSDETLKMASEQSKALLLRFVDEPGRSDYSPASFVSYLREAMPFSGQDAAIVQDVERILNELLEEVNDQKTLNLDQFEKACPTLLKYGQNLVKRGMNGQLPEALMRREFTDRVLRIINSDGDRTNILLTAPSGTGKTTAVMGLARRIADNDVPKAMQGAQMIQLNLAELQAEGAYKGEFEGKTKEIFSQLKQYLNQHPNQKVIIFIDEAHLMAQAEGDLSWMDLLRASGLLERKNLTFIGAAAPQDWHRSSLDSDQAFLGRFHAIPLPKFSEGEKLAILGRQASQLEKRNGVEIFPDILEKTLRQASAKWPENALPHAIDLLNVSASISKGGPLELASLRDQLQRKELWLQTLAEKKTMKGRFHRQLEQTWQEAESLRAEIERYPDYREPAKPDSAEPVALKEKHLQQAFAVLTGEKTETITRDELAKIRNAREVMGQHIVGQPEALAAIEQGLRKIAIHHKTGTVKNRPIVSMLLPGPTGVGKTEAAKVIAREFMNGNLIRLDMSEYMEKHALSLLTGAPPGYIGYDNGGLVDLVQKNPKSVVVFDEIEKAHPDVFNLLLQILEEGELRNNQNQPVSFRNAIIALTSNLNHRELTDTILKHRRGQNGKDPALAASQLEKEVRQLLTANPKTGRPGFRPEHLGRIDAVIPFSPLNSEHISQILEIQLRAMNEKPSLKDLNLQVTLSDNAIRRLMELISGTRHHKDAVTPLPGGAREVRSKFETLIDDRVMGDLALEPELEALENAVITVDYDVKKQDFQLRVTPKPAFEPATEPPLDSKPKTLAFA